MSITAINQSTVVSNIYNQAISQAENEAPVDEYITVSPSETDEQTIPAALSEDEEAEEQDNSSKGVLRLLQAGHFNGVADIRLRINFNEEIKALEDAKAAEMINQSIDSISSSLSGKIDTFLQTEGLDEITIAAVSDAQETLMSRINLSSRDNIVSTLESLYSEFKNSVSSAVEPQADEPEEIIVTDDNIPADEPTDVANNEIVIEPDEEIIPTLPAPTSTGLFLAELDEIFNQLMLELDESLLNISVLPEISPKTGNGAAYEKFMLIYNNMNNENVELPVAEYLATTI